MSNPNEVVGRESAMVLPMGVFVVGPYAAAVVPSRGEGGFDEWMAGHGYDIPAPTRVAVEHYQSLGFDFLVLRLRPQQGVHQMQPVRVSFRGYVPSLPLRMIAAGVADKVGLSLMVLAHTEVQAMNFRTAFVADGDLVFDFAANRSNYRALFNAALGPRSDPAWVVESSEPVTAPMMSDRMPAPQDAGFRPSLDSTSRPVPTPGCRRSGRARPRGPRCWAARCPSRGRRGSGSSASPRWPTGCDAGAAGRPCGAPG